MVSDILSSFEKHATAAGATQLTEGGRSPREYNSELRSTIDIVNKDIAFNAEVSLLSKNMPEYPANGPKTLTDGMIGSTDVGNAYLCFHERPMVVSLGLEEPVFAKKVIVSFLNAPARVVFTPASVLVEGSADGQKFYKIGMKGNNTPNGDTKTVRVEYEFAVTEKQHIRYLKITAQPFPNLHTLGARYSKNTRPIIACDEIRLE